MSVPIGGGVNHVQECLGPAPVDVVHDRCRGRIRLGGVVDSVEVLDHPVPTRSGPGKRTGAPGLQPRFQIEQRVIGSEPFDNGLAFR